MAQVRHPMLSFARTRVEVAGRQTMHPEWRQEKRTLEVHDLVYIESGQGELGIGQRTYPLQKDSWSLLPAGIPHWLTHDPEDPLTVWVIHFIIEPDSANTIFRSMRSPGALQVQDSARAQAAMTWSIDYFLHPDLQTQFLADRCLDLTLALILYEALPEWTTDNRLAKALTLIHHNPGSKISLQSLSRKIGLSPYHFRELFMKQLGESPSVYIRKLRILLARDLLRNTDKSMQEIAEAAGWENASTFIRTFQKETGQTPGRYRTITREMSG